MREATQQHEAQADRQRTQAKTGRKGKVSRWDPHRRRARPREPKAIGEQSREHDEQGADKRLLLCVQALVKEGSGPTQRRRGRISHRTQEITS